MDWRRDGFSKLLLVIGGEGVLHLTDDTFALRAPSVCIVPAGTRHRMVDLAGKPLSIYGVCVQSCGGNAASLIQAACDVPRVLHGDDAARRIQKWIRQILFEERRAERFSVEAQWSLVLRILVYLARHATTGKGERPDSRERVRGYWTSLCHGGWETRSLDAVARGLGLGRRRFTQLFREVAGESWLECLNRLRMDHAVRLLKSTDLPVNAVAFECGFGDLTHFYRVFRARYNISPGRFRTGSRGVVPGCL